MRLCEKYPQIYTLIFNLCETLLHPVKEETIQIFINNLSTLIENLTRDVFNDSGSFCTAVTYDIEGKTTDVYSTQAIQSLQQKLQALSESLSDLLVYPQYLSNTTIQVIELMHFLLPL
jgi:hypothetical protein